MFTAVVVVRTFWTADVCVSVPSAYYIGVCCCCCSWDVLDS